MPLFEYRCTECRRISELLVRATSRIRCPGCGSARLERLVSVPARPTTAAPAVQACEPPPGAGPCCGGGCGLN